MCAQQSPEPAVLSTVGGSAGRARPGRRRDARTRGELLHQLECVLDAPPPEECRYGHDRDAGSREIRDAAEQLADVASGTARRDADRRGVAPGGLDAAVQPLDV